MKLGNKVNSDLQIVLTLKGFKEQLEKSDNDWKRRKEREKRKVATQTWMDNVRIDEFEPEWFRPDEDSDDGHLDDQLKDKERIRDRQTNL